MNAAYQGDDERKTQNTMTDVMRRNKKEKNGLLRFDSRAQNLDATDTGSGHSHLGSTQLSKSHLFFFLTAQKGPTHMAGRSHRGTRARCGRRSHGGRHWTRYHSQINRAEGLPHRHKRKGFVSFFSIQSVPPLLPVFFFDFIGGCGKNV